MNDFYIEYILREKRREEAEACKRTRLLNGGSYSRTGSKKKLCAAISAKIFIWNNKIKFMGRSVVSFFTLGIHR